MSDATVTQIAEVNPAGARHVPGGRPTRAFRRGAAAEVTKAWRQSQAHPAGSETGTERLLVTGDVHGPQSEATHNA